MPATTAAPRPTTRPAVSADRVRVMLLELTYRLHASRPVTQLAAKPR